ncbi:hypothetical protein [Arthrobacter sp. KK5.5]|uniref:hypothetical protein n=1 Tax=Arthrobacter sp. KK5.5 TaxID=3373084 RepID=UPI003EE68462
MSMTAIVFHRHHGPTRYCAQLLADRLHSLGRRAQQTPVAEASPHEIVRAQAMVLVSPVTLGRLHGAALARDVAMARPTAVVLVGENDVSKHVRGLFNEEQLRNMAFFAVPGDKPDMDSVVPVADWISALPGMGADPDLL